MSCYSVFTVAVPGPEGVDGINGINGSAGASAFTTVANYSPSVQPIMPYPVQRFSANLTNGSPTVVMADTSTIVSGMSITGSDISNPTTVLNVVDSTHITLSTNALGTITTSLAFTQSVVVNTTSTTGFTIIGEIIGIYSWGYMSIINIPSDTSLLVTNPRDDTMGFYPTNANQGTSLAAGKKIVPAGIQGPVGAASSGAFLIANNLSEGTASTMRASLGLGTVATFNQGNSDTNIPRINDAGFNNGEAVFATTLGIETKSAANAVIAIGAQPVDPFLTSVAALGTAADKTIYTTGVNTAAETSLTAFMRTVIAAIDAPTARGLLGVGGTDILIYRDQHITGTSSSVFTPGSMQTVPLNTEVTDVGGHGSIAGNQITLAAGTYNYQFGVVGYKCGNFKGWLYNVSDSADIASSYGQDSFAPQNAGQPEFGNLTGTGQGRFTIATSKVITLVAQCDGAVGGNLFGKALSFGNSETFSYLILWFT